MQSWKPWKYHGILCPESAENPDEGSIRGECLQEVIGKLLKEFELEAEAGLENEKESQVNIEKLGDVVIVLVIELVKSVTFGKIRSRERQIRKNTQKQRGNLGTKEKLKLIQILLANSAEVIMMASQQKVMKMKRLSREAFKFIVCMKKRECNNILNFQYFLLK